MTSIWAGFFLQVLVFALLGSQVHNQIKGHCKYYDSVSKILFIYPSWLVWNNKFEEGSVPFYQSAKSTLSMDATP